VLDWDSSSAWNHNNTIAGAATFAAVTGAVEVAPHVKPFIFIQIENVRLIDDSAEQDSLVNVVIRSQWTSTWCLSFLWSREGRLWMISSK